MCAVYKGLFQFMFLGASASNDASWVLIKTSYCVRRVEQVIWQEKKEESIEAKYPLWQDLNLLLLSNWGKWALVASEPLTGPYPQHCYVWSPVLMHDLLKETLKHTGQFCDIWAREAICQRTVWQHCDGPHCEAQSFQVSWSPHNLLLFVFYQFRLCNLTC